MLKQALNELEIGLILTADSPLLIKDGRFGEEDRQKVEKAKRNIMPMAVPISRSPLDALRRAVNNPAPVEAVAKLDFFLPATSLRGAWRSYLERTLRGLDPLDQPRICDPLAVGKRDPTSQDEEDDVVVSALDASCSNILGLQQKEFAKRPDGDAFHPYAYSCPVCRLFGSTVQASRVFISDGERVAGKGGIVVREHVRINRHTGQVQGAPLKFFALQGAEFTVTLRVRNFEDSQVFLTGLLMEQLAGGLIPVGSGKSKGYGYLKAKVTGITVTAFGAEKPANVLPGIAEHPAGAGISEDYRLQTPKQPVPLPPGEWDTDPVAFWRHTRTLTSAQFAELWKKIPFDRSYPLLAEREVYK